jgi:hypothetical protein
MPVNPPAPKPAAVRKLTTAQVQAATREAQSKITDARYQGINSLFQISAIALLARHQYADAGALRNHGPGISREIVVLADSDDRVATFVDYLTTAGPYTGLMMAVLPLVLQIAANHGRIDADKTMMPGIVPPAELEREVKASITDKTAEMYRQAQNGGQP